MLFELLPHFARLVPAADKYLANRSASDKAHDAALTALAENVRGEVALVSETHAGIYRQLREQSTQISAIAVDVTRARMGMESAESRVAKLEKTVDARVAKLEKSVGLAVKLLWTGLALLSMVLALLAVMLWRR